MQATAPRCVQEDTQPTGACAAGQGARDWPWTQSRWAEQVPQHGRTQIPHNHGMFPAASKDSGLRGDLTRSRLAGHLCLWVSCSCEGRAGKEEGPPMDGSSRHRGGPWSLACLWSEGPLNLGVRTERKPESFKKKKKKGEYH